MNAPIKHADLSPQDLPQAITQIIFDAWAGDVMRTPSLRVDINLDREREILPNGKVREEYRAEVDECYRLGRLSSAVCCDLYDKYQLWPNKHEFFGIFYEGIRSFNEKESASNRRVSEDGSW